MKRLKKLTTGIALVLVAAALTMAPAEAEQYPSKPVTVVVGFSAGGGTDTYARILASVIPEYMNRQPLIVVNKPGGAQVPSMKFTAKSKPDGYTLQFFSTGSGVVATMIRDRGVDWFRDFEPVAQIGNINLSLVAHREMGFKTPQDVVAAVKKAHAAGKKLRWAHTGRGSITNMAALAWLIKNDIADMVQDVPFKGGAPTRAALLGKQVDFGAMGLQQTTGFMDKLIVLGIMNSKRDPIRKDAPTMKELGSPFVEMRSPMILAAPKGTPKDRIEIMAAIVKKATEHKAFKKLTKKAGLAVVYAGPDEAKATMAKLRDEWKPTIDFVRKNITKGKK